MSAGVVGDLPSRVAAVIAVESSWVPAWRRIVMIATLTAIGPWILAAVLPVPGVALMALGAALIARAVPGAAAQQVARHSNSVAKGDHLHHPAPDGPAGLDGLAIAIRHSRNGAQVVWLSAAFVLVGSVPVVVGAALGGATTLWPVLAVAVAVLTMVLQHRPPSRSAALAVGLERIEAFALVMVAPTAVLATQSWWR